MLVQGLAENLQRQNLTDLEKAEGVGRLIEAFGSETERSVSVKKTAGLLGYSVDSINELLRVHGLATRTKFQLNKTNPDISRRAITAALTLGGARGSTLGRRRLAPMGA